MDQPNALAPIPMRSYWCGKPVDEMTREELILAVETLGKLYNSTFSEYMRLSRERFSEPKWPN